MRSKPAILKPVLREHWPMAEGDDKRIAVWLSRKYLAQVFQESNCLRISINKTSTKGNRWDDGLTWDELQQIKHDIGYGNMLAVEIYPRDCDVVNVANMRHLWLPEFPLPFGWRR